MSLYQQIIAALRTQDTDLSDEKLHEFSLEIAQRIERESDLALLPQELFTQEIIRLSPTIQLMVAEKGSTIQDAAQYAFQIIVNQGDDYLSTIPESYRSEVYCPYPGLTAFSKANANYFCGRDVEIEAFLKQINQNPLVAVTGPSGVGKSSFILAGVLPHLEAKFGETAVYLTLRIHTNTDVLQDFALLLSGDISQTDEVIVQNLKKHDSALFETLQKFLGQGKQRIFLILDQFEAIFVGEEENREYERNRFLDNVLYAEANGSDSFLTTIITTRENFFEHPAYTTRTRLVEIIQHENVPLRPLNNTQLRQAIEQPLVTFNQQYQSNIQYQDGLVQLILNAFRNPAVSLPLVQYLLRLLWIESGRLTHFAYNSLGGLEQVLDRHAREVYKGFADDEQNMVKTVLIALVRPGISGEYTRKRIRREVLFANRKSIHQRKITAILTQLSDERSRIISEQTIGDTTYLELTHEIILRQWSFLQELIEARKERIEERERLLPTAELWLASKASGSEVGDSSYLYKGSSLKRVQRYIDNAPYPEDIDSTIASCYKASQQYRNRIFFRIFFATIVGAIAFFLIVNSLRSEIILEGERADENATAQAVAQIAQATAQAEVIVQSQIGAEAEAQAQARQLANESQVILRQSESSGQGGITLSILLAIESLLRTPTVEGETALLDGLQMHPQILVQLKTEGSITGLYFTADGRKMIATTWERSSDASESEGINKIFVFDTSSWEEIYKLTSLSTRIGTWVISGSANPTFLYIHESNKWLGLINGNEVAFYDLDLGNPLIQFNNEGFTEICSSLSQKILIRNSNQILLLDFWTNSQQIVYMENEELITSASIDREGQQIAIGTPNRIILQNLSTQEIKQIPYDEPVRAIMFSPDGRFLAIKSNNNQIRLWDTKNEDEAHTNLQDYTISNVAFSSDGNKAIVRQLNGEASLWQRCYSSEISIEQTTNVDGQIVNIDPTGIHSVIVEYSSANANSLVQINNLSSQQIISEKNYGHVIENANFSPDGHFVALTNGYRFSDELYRPRSEALIMNVQTGNVAYRLPHESPVISAIFNQDNHFIASGDIDGIIRVWETNTEGKQIARLQHFVPNGPLGSISHSSTSRLDLLSTSSDGKFIATGSRLNYSVKLWDTETGEQVAEIVHQNAISSIAFSPNGQWFATSEWCFQFCQEPISVHIWGLNGDRIAQIDLGEDYQKTTVSFSPDSSILIVETDQETIELWQTTTWEQINILSNVSHFIVSSNGHLITATNINSIFHIFNLSQEQEIGKIPEPLYLTFSFDGNRLAWVSRSGFIQVDELLDKSKQSFQIPYQGEIKGLTFNSNGQWLAVLGDDDSIVIWDVITQEQVAVKNDYASINSIDFSINNKLFIMVPQEQNIYIWDPLSDRDDLIIMSNSAKFEQFENYIFTSLLNETRIWDENTGREISRMIHDELVLDFIVNREYLITSTDGGSAYVWTWSQMNLISEACLHLTRNLTQKEWSTYFPNESYRQTCPNLNN